MGKLIEDVRTYGPVMKNAGLTTEETAELFARFEASGISVSRVMPGLNASMRRAADEGVTDLRGHLDNMLETVRAAPDDVTALKQATELFGAEGAQRLSVAIRSGMVPDLAALTASLAGSEGQTQRTYEATRTLADRYTEAKNKVTGVGQQVAGRPFKLSAGF